MNARDYALLQLDARPLPGWPARQFRRLPRETAAPVDVRDRALGENILIGVVKNLLLLQHLIEHYSRRRLNQIDPPVQKILAVALYQLRFLSRIPASAAVDEAVEQVKRFGLGRAGGFVNAVLRSATRNLTRRCLCRRTIPAAMRPWRCRIRRSFLTVWRGYCRRVKLCGFANTITMSPPPSFASAGMFPRIGSPRQG